MEMIRRQIAFHDAAFAVIGRALNVAIRPPARRCGLRLFEGDVFAAQDRSAETLEQMAVVAFAGRIALNGCQQGTQGDRDELMGKDLVFHGALARYGYDMRPEFVRGYIRSRAAELTAEAEFLVAEHWPAIEAEAAQLLAAPQRQAV